jgi:phospholipid-binding lipoprotein MlaA
MIAASVRGAVRCAVGLLLTALLAACATPPSDPAERAAFEQNNDPLEPLNRKTLDVNLFLDRILLKPVTKVYIAVVPEAGRDALQRALDNMKEPVIVINNALQGRPQGAGIAAGRFVVNSTLGVAGLFDIAAKWGLDKQSGDFGQTLFVWGLPEGPYLIVPVLGPSNPRDLVGMAGDNYLDPFSYLASAQGLDDISISRFVVGGIDQRARVIDVLDDLQKNSLDFYAQLRSLSQQHRAAELRHGKAAEPDPGFYEDPGKAPAAASPPPAAGSPPPAGPVPAAAPGPDFYQDPGKAPAKPAARGRRPPAGPAPAAFQAPPPASSAPPPPAPAPNPAPAAAPPVPRPPAGPIAAASQPALSARP